jgi:hypothetical protein
MDLRWLGRETRTRIRAERRQLRGTTSMVGSGSIDLPRPFLVRGVLAGTGGRLGGAAGVSNSVRAAAAA